MPSPKKVLFVANSAWNFWNYRRGLVSAVQQAGYEVVLAGGEDGFADRLAAPFYRLRYLRRSSPLAVRLPLAAMELGRLLTEEQPALCLFFTTPALLLGGVAARRMGIPYVSVVEGLGHLGTYAWRWRVLGQPLFRWALRGARSVLVLNSDDLRELVAGRVLSQAQVRLVPGPGIDDRLFSPVAPSRRQEVVFLYCGRLLKTKGVRLFAEAAQAVRAVDNRAIFRIVGAPDPGNPASIPHLEIERWRKDGAVEYFGAVDDVRPHIADADVVVLPTYYREGMPRALLEAMCMEKVVLATDTPGCREIVVPGQTGFLVPARNIRALVQAMLSIVALPLDLRIKIGQAARQRVVQRFSERVVLPQYLQAIKESL